MESGFGLARRSNCRHYGRAPIGRHPDEETLRRSVKLINEKIIEFRGTFAGKDMQDFIAMVLIWFATEQSKNGGQHFQLEETISKLSHMEELIDKALSGSS